MTVQIIEILRRSKQGMTRPFICRGDDGNIYFVKGRGAGRRSLLAEYICGRLAIKFGLPIADFSIVELPDALINASTHSEIADLGTGLAFGSKAVLHSHELQHHQLRTLNQQTCKDILVFDWWIRNQDRTLSAQGGNPNLLWDLSKPELVVIDHNVALEMSFDSVGFAQSHVFAGLIPAVFDDLYERAAYSDRMQEAFVEFDLACHDIPLDWWTVDDGVPSLFDKMAVREFLGSISHNNFWRIAK